MNYFKKHLEHINELNNNLISKEAVSKILQDINCVQLADYNWPIAIEIDLSDTTDSASISIGFPLKTPQNTKTLDNFLSLKSLKNFKTALISKQVEHISNLLEKMETDHELYPSRAYIALEETINFIILTVKDPFLFVNSINDFFIHFYQTEFKISNNSIQLQNLINADSVIEHLGYGERSGIKIHKVYIRDHFKNYLEHLTLSLKDESPFSMMLELKESTDTLGNLPINVVVDIYDEVIVRIGIEIKFISINKETEICKILDFLNSKFCIDTMPPNKRKRIKEQLQHQQNYIFSKNDISLIELYHLKVSFKLTGEIDWKLYLRCSPIFLWDVDEI